jgi:hypothetical protein
MGTQGKLPITFQVTIWKEDDTQMKLSLTPKPNSAAHSIIEALHPSDPYYVNLDMPTEWL